MFYVYLLRSLSNSDQTYVGYTENLNRRFAAHNSGESVHTAAYKPWEMVAYFSFKDKQKALFFEKYLKSGSGRAFAAKRFW